MHLRMQAKNNLEVEIQYGLSLNGMVPHTLHRGARAKGERFTADEFVDLIPDGGGSLRERERIETLHKIIPKQLKEFFLVDGEYMETYRDLIASSDTSMKDEIIRNQIEQIIGLPVLKDANDFDFPEIKSGVSKQHKELAKINSDAKDAYDNLEAIRSNIKNISKTLDDTRSDLIKQQRVRNELWDWIVEHKDESKLADDFTKNKGKIEEVSRKRKEILLERRKALSKDENGTWLSILQPHLLDLMKSAKLASDEIADLVSKKSKLEGKLEEKYNILKNKNEGI